MKSNPLVSIVIPCYNEAGNIPHLYKKIEESVNFRNEIILVDDGSCDTTLNEIEILANEVDNLKYISFTRNFGHQNALKAGIEHSQGDCVISMDADLQHPPALMLKMVELWQEGYDVVNTIRKDSKNTGLVKRITSKLFYFALNKLSEIEIKPGSADFRLIDRRVVNEIKKIKETQLFFRGLIPWMGFNQTEVSYTPNQRYSGSSKYSLKKMVKFATTGITSFSTKPLKIAVVLGFVISLLSVAYAIYALIVYFFTEKAISGWTSLIISILFIGGLQITLLGVIGEYLGKLFIESKKRQSYIVNKSNINGIT